MKIENKTVIAQYERSKTCSSKIWITPQKIIQALGTFDLDPCGANPRPWETASKTWTEEEDGLSKVWHGRVWLNPPYGAGIEKWMEKLAKHGDGIAVVNVRTDTAWFQKWVFPFASGLFFFRGRIPFYRPDGSIGRAPVAPHVLIAYGSRNGRVLSSLEQPGFWIPVPSMPQRADGEKILSLESNMTAPDRSLGVL